MNIRRNPSPQMPYQGDQEFREQAEKGENKITKL